MAISELRSPVGQVEQAKDLATGGTEVRMGAPRMVEVGDTCLAQPLLKEVHIGRPKLDPGPTKCGLVIDGITTRWLGGEVLGSPGLEFLEVVVEPIEALVNRGEVQAYMHHGFWQAMDTLRD